MRAVWPLAAAFALLAQSPPLPQTPPRDRPEPPRGTASISGRILASDTGLPLGGGAVALMLLRSTDEGGSSAPARWGGRADATGRFVFTNLPAGRYSLFAGPPVFKDMYLSTPTSRFGVPSAGPLVISLADGESRKDVDVRLPRAGALSGRVLDEQNQPLMRVQVRVLGRPYPGREFTSMGYGEMTDDQGRYRLPGLQPGDYYVQAEGMHPAGPSSPDEESREAYVPTFYPGTPNQAEASLLSLGIGEEITDLDIRLVRGRTFKISGLVLDAEGKPAGGAQVSVSFGSPGRGMNSGHVARADGTFEFVTLPPGDYVLSARARDSSWERPEEGVAGVRVAVVSTDVENVTLAMHRGVTVQGQVVTSGGGLPPFESTGFKAVLETPDSLGPRRSTPVEIDQNWRFQVDHVFSPAMVRLQGAFPPEWFLQAVRYRGRDVSDTPTGFESDPTFRDLQLVLSDRPARIQGVVRDDTGKPAAMAQVVIFAPDVEPQTGPIMGPLVRRRTARARADGTYVLPRLSAGEYLIVAIDPSSFGMDPFGSSLATLAPHATRVTINEGEERALDLVVIAIRQ